MPRPPNGTPLTRDPHGRMRVVVTLTPEEAARLDAARGSIPAATWAREAIRRELDRQEK